MLADPVLKLYCGQNVLHENDDWGADPAAADQIAFAAKRVGAFAWAAGGKDPQIAALEAEILSAVNATGIGPGGLGGDTTALSVHVATAPCHIAALPVAVNLGCSAVRSASVEVPA